MAFQLLITFGILKTRLSQKCGGRILYLTNGMDQIQSSYGDEDMFVFSPGLLTLLFGFLNTSSSMDQFRGKANVLIPRFHRLYLAPHPPRRRRRLRRQMNLPSPLRKTPLPAWAQMRRLSAEASQLIEQGQSRTPSVLFLAMLAILSCQVPNTQSLPDSKVLWAYVPDPPVLRPITWADPAFPVYTNDTSILGFPSATHITPQRANYSYSAQAISPPVSMPLTNCVAFLPIIPSTNGPYCFELDMKHLVTYEGPSALLKGETSLWRDWTLSYYGIRESWNVSSPDSPIMERTHCNPTNCSLDAFPTWNFCYPKQHTALNYTLSTGFSLYDWSVSSPLCADIKRYQVPGGWAVAIFSTASGHVYTSLWHLFTALVPSYWQAGSLSTTYPSRSPHYVKACVASPYASLYGRINTVHSNGHYSTLVFPTPTILVHQPLYAMLPVNLTGSWYDECSLQVLHQIRDLMIRLKRFIGLSIASILAIVTVVATAASATVSLAHSVQTASYVNHLARNISVSMGAQMDIDKKLEAKLNALEQTLTVLGDKVYNMQSHMILRCHVDFKYICVTNTPYNDTEWSWPLVKAHLQGIWSHNNLSLDVLKLQQQIHAIDFSRQELPRDTTIAHDIVDTLSSWTHGFHLPSLSTIIAIGSCVLLLIILLPFLFRLVFSSLQWLQLKFFELHLKTKKEGN
ncbi:envelope glycoprotein, partial [Plecturocebus cupreus]